MTSDRIKEIQEATAYPESRSVSVALHTVWNETLQEVNHTHEAEINELKDKLAEYENNIIQDYEVYRCDNCGEMDIPNVCHCGSNNKTKVRVVVFSKMEAKE